MNNSKKLVRILVPVLIAAAIAAIWFFKNQQTQPMDSSGNLGTPLEITTLDLEEIKSHGLPVILDFGADSCVPCQRMWPDLVEMNKEMQGKAVVHFTDVWKYPEVGQDFPIQVIPTQMLINSDGSPYVPSDGVFGAIPDFQMYTLDDSDEHVLTLHQGGLTSEQMRMILADMGVEQ